jgi:D-sedoheptulose 7-phosphate isomerase
MADRSRFAEEYLNGLVRTARGMPLDDIAKLLEILEVALRERRLILLAGNGGSAATASHMANDLMNGVAQGGKSGFRAIALSDNVPAITAVANDLDYREIFARQIEGLAQPGDVLLLISGSGNSPNLLRAVECARTIRMTTLALLGMGGGKLAGLVDFSVIAPSDDYGPIEDIHMVLDHLITAYFRNRLSTNPEH